MVTRVSPQLAGFDPAPADSKLFVAPCRRRRVQGRTWNCRGHLQTCMLARKRTRETIHGISLRQYNGLVRCAEAMTCRKKAQVQQAFKGLSLDGNFGSRDDEHYSVNDTTGCPPFARQGDSERRRENSCFSRFHCSRSLQRDTTDALLIPTFHNHTTPVTLAAVTMRNDAIHSCCFFFGWCCNSREAAFFLRLAVFFFCLWLLLASSCKHDRGTADRLHKQGTIRNAS